MAQCAFVYLITKCRITDTNPCVSVVLSDDPTSFTITVTSDAGENGESEYTDVCACKMSWISQMAVMKSHFLLN